ncbi:MAG TPA: glycoside hydrolase family 3 protein, partial [Rhodobacteraceae bacterium]|nr:glycoside hydrolase family 3 protein [Paracoccaceae bacterium]
VERMTRPHWRHWLPALDQVDLNPAQADRGMYIRYRIIAGELRAVGIDSNCAPVGDVAMPQTHGVLRNRCYSEDPAKVASIGRAVADGLLDGGVLPVLKHIPGHGRATLDSHKELPRVSTNRAGLEAVDFAAMRALADLPMGMSAHIVYEDIDASGPATTSPVMVDLIRNDIGFSGLLMSDDLSMDALQGDVSTRARNARNAGMDLILHCNGKMPEMQMVVDAVGNFTHDAQKRADLAINARKSPDNVDIPALEDELAGLLKRA